MRTAAGAGAGGLAEAARSRATPAGSVRAAGGGACSPRALGSFFLPRDARTARRLPHSPRRSSASPHPTPSLPLLRERDRCLRAGIAVAGAWGGGGARAALCFCRGPWDEGPADEALSWSLGRGRLARSDLGLCTRGDFHGHLWG